MFQPKKTHFRLHISKDNNEKIGGIIAFDVA